ncbi:ribonuclease domain-containing protein [Thermomonas fusca]|uniref:Ribonuclease n=1 Tax=Thermomonas fusca TaxID=215690 RepID=A0A5R9PH38_9GAMM|nr:ribonuclease domain-containing protein [Thermomonas fusca]TLX22068.1 ribonuclease [Thermomonas fusca]
MRLRNPIVWLLLAIALAAGWQQWRSRQQAPAATHDFPAAHAPALPTAVGATTSADSSASNNPALPAFLPPEARATLGLIQRGGPYPYRQDGQVFGNREGLLPRQPRGWYREYTVDTPGLRHRGARRIVTGGNPPREWYYSDDHYRSFRSFSAGMQP